MVTRKLISRRRFLQKSATGVALLNSLIAASSRIVVAESSATQPTPVPDKLVVLTFDDAVKSQRTVVAPLLKELGFGATFFISPAWMNDPSVSEYFLTWKEIAELHAMGFEIGNHTWRHDGSAPGLASGLAQVVDALSQVGVPRPTSFAWPGNLFGPESIKILMDNGINLARRGFSPEFEYGRIVVGPAFDPTKHHPLLIPTAGDSYPSWTFEHFQQVVATARQGRIAVLQFHGVPDLAHHWVHTPPEMFRQYMTFLKEQGYRAIAVRDLKPYIDFSNPPDDPLLRKPWPGAMDSMPRMPRG